MALFKSNKSKTVQESQEDQDSIYETENDSEENQLETIQEKLLKAKAELAEIESQKKSEIEEQKRALEAEKKNRAIEQNTEAKEEAERRKELQDAEKDQINSLKEKKEAQRALINEMFEGTKGLEAKFFSGEDEDLKEQLKVSKTLQFDESKEFTSDAIPEWQSTYDLSEAEDFFTLTPDSRTTLYNRIGLFKGIVVDYSKENPIDQSFRNVVNYGKKKSGLEDDISHPVDIFYKKPRLSGFYETTYALEESQRKSQETGIFNLSFGLSASYNGVVASAGLKAGFSYGKDSFTSKNTYFKEISLISSLFLPKIELSLDTLKPCAADDLVKHLRNAFKENEKEKQFDEVHRILLHYGQFIPTNLVIGGRLYSSDTKKIQSSDTIENVLTKYAAEFKASFSGAKIEAGVEGSMKHETSSKTNEKNNSESQRMQFNAVGGDGAFLTDKDAWVKSTSKSNGWGLVRFDNLVPVLEILPEKLKQECIDLFDFVVMQYPIEHLLSKGAHFLFYKGYYERFGCNARPKTLLIKNTQGGKSVMGVKASDLLENGQSVVMSLYDGNGGDLQEWYFTEAGKVYLKSSYESNMKFVLSIDSANNQLVITQDEYFDNQVWSFNGGLIRNIVTNQFIAYNGNQVKLVADLKEAKQTTWMLVTEEEINEIKKPKANLIQQKASIKLTETQEGSDTLFKNQYLSIGKYLISENNKAKLTFTNQGLVIEWMDGKLGTIELLQTPIETFGANKVGILDGLFVALGENNEFIGNIAPSAHNIVDIQLLDCGNFEAMDENGDIVWESNSIVFSYLKNTESQEVITLKPSLDFSLGTALELQPYLGGDHQLWYLNRKNNIVSKFQAGNQKYALTELSGIGNCSKLGEFSNSQLWNVQFDKKTVIQNRISKSNIGKGSPISVSSVNTEKWELVFDTAHKSSNMLTLTKNSPSTESFITHSQLFTDYYLCFVMNDIPIGNKEITALRLHSEVDPSYDYAGYHLFFLEFFTSNGEIIRGPIGELSTAQRQNYVSDGLNFPNLFSPVYLNGNIHSVSLVSEKISTYGYTLQFVTKNANGVTKRIQAAGYEFVNPRLSYNSTEGITSIDTAWVKVPNGHKLIGLAFTKIGEGRLGPCILSLKN